jgi:hypothetical protein
MFTNIPKVTNEHFFLHWIWWNSPLRHEEYPAPRLNGDRVLAAHDDILSILLAKYVGLLHIFVPETQIVMDNIALKLLL